MTLAIITSIACSLQLIIAASGAGSFESDVEFCREFSTPPRSAYNSGRLSVTLSPEQSTDVCNAVCTKRDQLIQQLRQGYNRPARRL